MMRQYMRLFVLAFIAGSMSVLSGFYAWKMLAPSCNLHWSNDKAVQLLSKDARPPPALTGVSQSTTLLDHRRSERRNAGYSSTASPLNLKKSYSRTMVVPHMSTENISWIDEHLPDLRTVRYTANDVLAPHHPPRNKGHEVMIYLTFILEHYERLPDVVIFMHAHRYSHHNSQLLDFDAVRMIERLSSRHVVRHGYVNMRCDWSPGCPEWLHPGARQEVLEKQEEVVLSEVWHELFPERSLPRTLAQACCAQFAVSREAIRLMPKSRYIYLRDWILRTPLSDYVSGRIWEYCWQSLFVSRSTFCPNERVCHCDGFGVCFGGQYEFEAYKQLQRKREIYHDEVALYQWESIRIQGLGEQVLGETGIQGDLRRSWRVQYRLLAIEEESKAQIFEALERGDSLRSDGNGNESEAD